MDTVGVAVVCAGLLAYSLISGKLAGTVITAPIVFIAFGFAVGDGGLGIASLDPGHRAVHILAEVTLLVVLFTDAARIDLTALRRDHKLPQRMLVVGLPLVMVSGLVLALLFLPALSFWEAALLSALLAPTDAALGQAVVSAREVPSRIRQAINVESGLNDGIALPAVLLFAALASAAATVDSGYWLRFAALQIVLAPVVGGFLGYLGARGIDAAAEKGWAGDSFLGIGILSLAFFAFVVSELVGGNGFIAVFVAGMVFGHSLRHPCTFLFEFMETEGQLLMLLTFLIFGAALFPEALAHVDAATVGYAIASLTVVRVLPVACSLLGSGLAWPSVLFLGWFGPRGLASILFVLLILERSDVSNKEQIFAVTMVTVAISAVLHGVTAAPLARIYARRAAGMGECEENRPVVEMPLRDQVKAEQAVQRTL